MFIINWLKNLLEHLNWDKLNAKIIFIGLDNAGKTTLLRKLKDGRTTQNPPTQHAHSESIQIGSTKVRATDIGGHKAVRKIWKNYYQSIDGICYLIDSSKPEFFQESKNEFQKLVESIQDKTVPIAILGNKIDMESAVSMEKLEQLFEIENIKTNQGQSNVQLFMCSVTKGVGYSDALTWLTKQIKERRKTTRSETGEN